MMPTVLITAFEPYDRWSENASWAALVALTRNLPQNLKLVTRRYPVDFAKVRKKLAEDLAADYDYALHLGQAPGIARIHLEEIGINIGGHSNQSPDEFQPLVADGPTAYRSQLPLARWASLLRSSGIPAAVSYHAGTYLCNATLYLTHYFAAQQGLKTKAAFIHLPLTPEQVVGGRQDIASMPSQTAASGLQRILSDLEAVEFS